MLVQPQPDLLEIVAARRESGCLAGCLDGGKKQADERADDRDHHQKFDERESGPMGPAAGKTAALHDQSF
jgi:hypothetical protein